MAVELSTIVREMQRLAGVDGPGAVSDDELLTRFVSAHDATAFELLVWRHGGMVLAVCRRHLGPTSDADDAFQAVFLALVRQARRIRQGSKLPAWLHRVAHRVCAQSLRRRPLTSLPDDLEARPLPEANDLGPLLDAEIDRLPERLRFAVVLCYLQGRSAEEAGRLLGCPRGTILSRLARARDRLRHRLERRGIVPTILPGVDLPATLVESAVRPVLGLETLTATTPPIVVSLAEGAIHSMWMTKMKTTTAIVLTTVALIGGSTMIVTRTGVQASPGNPPAPAPQERLTDLLFGETKLPPEEQRLQGEWLLVRIREAKGSHTAVVAEATFRPGKFEIRPKDVKARTMTYKLDLSKSPRGIQIDGEGGLMRGTFRFDTTGDVLTIELRAVAERGAASPEQVTLVLERVKRSDKPGAASADWAGERAALLDQFRREAERARMLELMAAEARTLAEQQARAAQAAEMAARDQAKAAAQKAALEAERARAQQVEALALKSQSDAQRRLIEAAQAQAMQLQKEMSALLEKRDDEIKALRSKVPQDAWDAGWSQLRATIDGWGLRVLPDGSGIWGAGLNLEDFTTFPAGTFDFIKVRRDLMANARLDGKGAKAEISLQRKGEDGTLRVYLADPGIIKTLLRTAKAKGSTPSLDQRWKQSFETGK